MDLGFETIGNATLLCHDKKPVLVTDPWVQGSAYFGSWGLSHPVPRAQFDAALACDFVWFSHGHPDHMNPESLPLFKGKQILLADHVGGRIKTSLQNKGFNVRVLEDRKWYRLSDNIRVLSIADTIQDAILLVDIGGTLVINLNDTAPGPWVKFVRRTVKQFKKSFLLALCCYGDVDMINFYTEDGKFIEPYAAKKVPLGPSISLSCELFDVDYFAPFSSMHRYQREDSVWANRFGTKLTDYAEGFPEKKAKLLPAFISYDLKAGKYDLIHPPLNTAPILTAAECGDNWSDELDKSDVRHATAYFYAVEPLWDSLDFITLKVGGKEHRIGFKGASAGRGITFEAPRHSLMKAIEWEIFDDMLIGNFMKTTLHGNWEGTQLYPHLVPALTKYADNGLAKTHEAIAQYLQTYERRSLDNVIYGFEERAKDLVRSRLSPQSVAYTAGKKLFWKLRKLTG